MENGYHSCMANKRKKTEPEKTPFIKKCEEILGHHLYSDELSVQWTTGGMTGGSCWMDGDEDPHYPVEAEKEPEFDDLDKIIEGICPTITFIQYKNLVKAVVKEESYTDNEYYGNHYDRAKKSVNLHVLATYLQEKGLWDE